MWDHCVKGLDVHGEKEVMTWSSGIKSEGVKDVEGVVSVLNIGG